MDIHRSFNFLPNTEKLKLITIWVNDITPTKVELCCMYQKLIGFQVVTDFYKKRKVFDDTIVKQPITLGDLDFSEDFSEQLVGHVYKDDEYYWSDGNPYKSMESITTSILTNYRAHHSTKTVEFDQGSIKIIECERFEDADLHDTPLPRARLRKNDAVLDSDSESGNEAPVSI